MRFHALVIVALCSSASLASSWGYQPMPGHPCATGYLTIGGISNMDRFCALESFIEGQHAYLPYANEPCLGDRLEVQDRDNRVCIER